MPHINIYTILYLLPALLVGLTFHEFAHARVAYSLGDPTAKNQGRLTLNPIKHLDPLGALFLLIFQFGWAKPVPINPFHFKGDRQKGILWVSLAGPASNLLIALITALIWKLIGDRGPVVSNLLGFMLHINVVLAVFNIIPVPPLDGSKILAGLLPRKYSPVIFNLERYGYVILLLLMLFGVVGAILMPFVNAVENLIVMLFGIPF